VINDLKSFKIFLREVLGCEEYSKDDTLTNDGNYLEINDELSAVMVTDVIEGPGQAVYDLTIDGTHSFIANGFIVHNTAAVIKEKQSGEYFLEAGAMVLADGGIVCIDEIDKMRDEDRVAIHEAMEQGTVSIAKAGIVARLNARASVLAAGNPKYGRYIPSRPIAENINLPITILSRFDLIFTLRDLTDVERDRSLVRHVLRTHEAIEEVRPEIPPDILRKYVAYARKYVKPRLTRDAELLIEEFYLEMRRKSAEVPEAPIAITTRQLEALIRLAEAHARMALKNHVDVEDAAEAIRLMNVMLENVGIDVETGQIDIDVIMTGKPKSIRDKELIIKDIIKELSSEEGCAKIKDIVREAVKKGIDEDFVEKYITSLRRAGELYEVRAGCVNFVE
jgi:replicative DNA helicase Mcm